ncbi:metal-dependent hydrolase, beta-lactamase superfamily I [Chthonomonas calidirosea]|uniref:Metal-dependent hydrolases of the beta-lactamase superfamily I n=1 Tax=Chthonomonas calidirosea (strain DSM 23976 / ICMP 18418 / T49) TaxID=1303518 RepID=S0EVW9_CHTCT|nr:MBL fold metallo-hydrolase [Chthonomonas calidirosea]CCW35951.1 Metal-dependent hydrolases of the beta-lactamase superfamily I [Chthonomonas calidirosea T49]CEK18767.1 metal-dependent hydrolase, beta-lactamase superfamily I [Chthonomonas calidirosea]
MLEIIILGSGTSHGVPMIGCDCAVCRSNDPRNKRTRPSIAVKGPNGTILVDTPPELRLQAIACNLRTVDAVLFTHTHADHLMGLDDLRRYNDLMGKEIPIYGDASTLEDIRRVFRYVFIETQAGGGKPRLQLFEVQSPMELCGLIVEAFYVLHGHLPVLAYRFRNPQTQSCMAYVTDVSHIPPEAMEKLYHLDLLIIDAVRYDPHPTHFGLWQTLEVIEQLQPKQALLTHLSHHFDHTTLCAETPAHVNPAYDGQVIRLE